MSLAEFLADRLPPRRGGLGALVTQREAHRTTFIFLSVTGLWQLPVRGKSLWFYQSSPLGEPGMGETDIHLLLTTVIVKGTLLLVTCPGPLEQVRLVVVLLMVVKV